MMYVTLETIFLTLLPEGKMTVMEDKKILELYWQRDEKAIDVTAKQYGRAIYQQAKRLLCVHEEAEECENDTYWQAWRSIPPARPVRLLSYLLVLCRNIACNRLDYLTAKRRHSVVAELSLELDECIGDPNNEIEDIVLRNLLADFLKGLPPDQRAIFVRRYLFGDSISEIGKRYHFSESKVKMTLLRVREKLKRALENDG